MCLLAVACPSRSYVSQLCKAPTDASRPCCSATATKVRSALHPRQHWSHASRTWHRQAPSRQPRATPRLQAQGHGEISEELDMPKFLQALLLAYFASQSRSLVAARCFVELLIEGHRRGMLPGQVETAVRLAALESGQRLVAEQEQDVLISWAALVLLTLAEIGVPTYAESAGRPSQPDTPAAAVDSSRTVAGLRAFVSDMVAAWRRGFDSSRMLLQQSLAQDSEGRGGERFLPPSVKIMQQNTRLCILTLEAVRDGGLPTSSPLDRIFSTIQSTDEEDEVGGYTLLTPPPPAGESQQPAGAADAAPRETSSGSSLMSPTGFVYGLFAAEQADRTDPRQERLAARGVAVQLLLACTGAVHSSLYAAQAFVQIALDAYRAGWSVGQLYGTLREDEFAQSGGLLPMIQQPSLESRNINAQIFARWVSLVYMTAAQLGVPHPSPPDQMGWAWLPGADPFEAHSLSNFVGNALINAGQAPASPVSAPSPALELVKARGQEEAGGPQQQAAGEGRPSFVVMPDPELAQTSASLAFMAQQVTLVQLTREAVVGASSS